MSKNTRVARAASRVSLAVLLSRALGLVRELVLAAVFGASATMDAWIAAFRIPGMLRDLVAEGALSSAFIPTFSRVLTRDGRQQAWSLVNMLMSTLTIVLGVLAILFFVFSDELVGVFVFGFGEIEGKVELTSNLVKIISPFLILVALASIVTGVLNTFDRFFLPAVTTAFFNLAIILSVLVLAPALENRGIPAIYAVGGGAVLGGALQLLVQLPSMRTLGFRFHFVVDLKNSELLRIAALIGPAIIGVGATQMAVMVNTMLASTLGDGPVSWLNFAFRIIYLPIGLFGVAVGIVNLRDVSVHAARRNLGALKETVANSLKMVLVLAIPSTVGIIVLANPIVSVVFERGEFSAFDTQQTANALMLYCLGLVAYSCVKVYVPTFYALSDTKTPVRISVATALLHIVLNLAFILIFFPEGYEYLGLALGTAIALIVNLSLLASRFSRKLGSFSGLGVMSSFVKASLASMIMGVFVWLVYSLTAPMAVTFSEEVAVLSVSIVSGIVTYLMMGRLLGLEELELLWQRKN